MQPQVAGKQPAIAQRLRRGVRVAIVAVHQEVGGQGDLPDLALDDGLEGAVQDRHAASAHRRTEIDQWRARWTVSRRRTGVNPAPARGDDHRLRHAVGGSERLGAKAMGAEGVDQGGGESGVNRLGPADQGAQAREVERLVGLAGKGGEQQSHGEVRRGGMNARAPGEMTEEGEGPQREHVRWPQKRCQIPPHGADDAAHQTHVMMQGHPGVDLIARPHPTSLDQAVGVAQGCPVRDHAPVGRPGAAGGELDEGADAVVCDRPGLRVLTLAPSRGGQDAGAVQPFLQDLGPVCHDHSRRSLVGDPHEARDLALGPGPGGGVDGFQRHWNRAGQLAAPEPVEEREACRQGEDHAIAWIDARRRQHRGGPRRAVDEVTAAQDGGLGAEQMRRGIVWAGAAVGEEGLRQVRHESAGATIRGQTTACTSARQLVDNRRSRSGSDKLWPNRSSISATISARQMESSPSSSKVAVGVISSSGLRQTRATASVSVSASSDSVAIGICTPSPAGGDMTPATLNLPTLSLDAIFRLRLISPTPAREGAR